MKKLFLIPLLMICGCQSNPEYPLDLPPNLQTEVDSDLLIFKTEDIRVAKVNNKQISYEYNDQHITLAQIGAHAKKFCSVRGKDTVMVNAVLSNRHNFRRADFECWDKPVLVPAYHTED